MKIYVSYLIGTNGWTTLYVVPEEDRPNAIRNLHNPYGVGHFHIRYNRVMGTARYYIEGVEVGYQDNKSRSYLDSLPGTYRTNGEFK